MCIDRGAAGQIVLVFWQFACEFLTLPPLRAWSSGLQVHLFYDLRSLVETRHFYSTALGLSERAVRAATWPEVSEVELGLDLLAELVLKWFESPSGTLCLLVRELLYSMVE